MARLIETIRQERESILEIATRYQAKNVRLFGSVARGEDQSDSDIDFLVDFQPGSTLFDQVSLIEALSRKLGRKVDVISARALNRHLCRRESCKRLCHYERQVCLYCHGTGMYRLDKGLYLGFTLESFLSDRKTQDAVVRNLEIIGQALKDYGIDVLAEKRPDMPWSQITGMRNVLAHEYLGVDMVMIWDTVQLHLTDLQQALKSL
jgi:uncharacterized protein with HEPN domain/predicted nucleotidyltransferase